MTTRVNVQLKNWVSLLEVLLNSTAKFTGLPNTCPLSLVVFGSLNSEETQKIVGISRGRLADTTLCTKQCENSTVEQVKNCWEYFLANLKTNPDYKDFDDIFDYKKIIKETLDK